MAQKKYKAPKYSEDISNPIGYLVERPNLPSLFSTYLILNQSDIESKRLVTDDEAKKVFRGKGISAGFVVKVKASTKLLSIDELMKIYNVKTKDLTIVVDGLDIEYPDLLYASKSAVQFVKISDANRRKAKVIYIRTFKPLPNPNDY